ncbi:MarR family winged helix-turn-helix transcriptional regulator [Solibacillus sp. R5-41]|uniref:MarR family winged helix-turn-helix transcriptional regulator n=1 Tax=Solibacillus sp. R5-41 TaxID=2048654 RepID=UPI0020A55255|nr:MarR family winged helix-turn-helix transcriptional regulator [Solibacillus sp. R5-41]
MKYELHNPDVIDLLSERYEILRRLAEQKWINNNNVYISNSEWSIMGRIYKKQLTISDVAKGVDFSRQATHKFIKSLEAKELVEVSSVQHSKKHKAINMTEFGKTCYEKNILYKREIEQQLIQTLGEVEVTKLKEILTLNWDIEQLKV